MDDCVWKWHNAHSLAPDSDEMRVEVLNAVAFGSQPRFRSPFLHTSLSLQNARSWMVLGRENRGEDPKQQMMAKIDLWAWYQAGGLTEDMVIDLSAQPRQAAFFGKPPGEFGEWFEDNFHHIRKAGVAKEILIKWRGAVPIQYFEIVDDCNSSHIGWLKDMLSTVETVMMWPATCGSEQISSTDGSQPSSSQSVSYASAVKSGAPERKARPFRPPAPVAAPDSKPALSPIAQDMADRVREACGKAAPPPPKPVGPPPTRHRVCRVSLIGLSISKQSHSPLV